jgi:hypothetical protein
MTKDTGHHAGSAPAPGTRLPKYAQVAERVRAQVAGGVLVPGASAPSGAELARATGYSVLTCRKALRTLISDGVLVPGASPSARPRVPAPGGQRRAGAARALSAALVACRRAAGLTQPRFAGLVGVSVTTVGHAETCRLWQGRAFWERADKELRAGGDLLRLHDAYRAAVTPPDPGRVPATPAGSGHEFDRIYLEKLRLAAQVLLEAAPDESFIPDPLEVELGIFKDRVELMLLLPETAGDEIPPNFRD